MASDTIVDAVGRFEARCARATADLGGRPGPGKVAPKWRWRGAITLFGFRLKASIRRG
ncbi:MAG: hypothetical protein NVSMB19_26640 [Vulcanimicrobiaceae bacterium]